MVQKDREKVNQVYQSLFEEIFLSNANQPLSFIQCKTAFHAKLGDRFTQDIEDELEEFFTQAGDDVNRQISKEEVLRFICASIESNRFLNLFNIDESEELSPGRDSMLSNRE